VTGVQTCALPISQIAPRFGYDAADVARYNNDFRNVVLAYLSPERLMMIYDNKGLEDLVKEVSKLRNLKLI